MNKSVRLRRVSCYAKPQILKQQQPFYAQARVHDAVTHITAIRELLAGDTR